MKKLLFLLFLASAAQLKAAYPAYEAFDTNGFDIIYPKIFNKTTNYFTIIGGVLQPITGNSILLTNIVGTSNTVFTGTISLYKKSQLLSLGTNVLGSDVNSMFYCISPTNDPAQVTIALKDGITPGQLLLLVNYTNAVPSDGAFTVYKDSLVSGGGHVIQPEDWIATNTFAALYTWQAPDWLMIDAFAANGQSIWQTNYYQNIVVTNSITIYSNIVMKGNGKLIIQNISISTNDLWHTNDISGVATLQPVNLSLQPYIQNGLMVGSNSFSSIGHALTNGYALVMFNNTSAGDPEKANILLVGSTNGVLGAGVGYFSAFGGTNQSAVAVTQYIDTRAASSSLYVDHDGPQIKTQWTNSVLGVNFTPAAADSVTPFKLNANLTHTTGSLMEWANNSTNYMFTSISGPQYRLTLNSPDAGTSMVLSSDNSATTGIGSGAAVMDIFGTGYNYVHQAGSLLSTYTSDLGSNVYPWNTIYVGSTNQWKLMGVTEGVTTNVQIWVNGKTYTFQAW